jgi:hypothetical protein|nr:MAG TPA: hypothetical protein [Caudoviricetes sp.]
MKTTVKSEIEQCLENNFREASAEAKKSALEDIEQVVDDYTKDLNDDLIDFALEVVWQYGYKIGDGVYATGGMSVVESAFSILEENNMLDEDGNYSVYLASV